MAILNLNKKMQGIKIKIYQYWSFLFETPISINTFAWFLYTIIMLTWYFKKKMRCFFQFRMQKIRIRIQDIIKINILKSSFGHFHDQISKFSSSSLCNYQHNFLPKSIVWENKWGPKVHRKTNKSIYL